MEHKEQENLFKSEAKLITDVLFENKLFIDSLTRDDLNAIEKIISTTLDSRFRTHLKLKDLTDKIKL